MYDLGFFGFMIDFGYGCDFVCLGMDWFDWVAKFDWVLLIFTRFLDLSFFFFFFFFFFDV
jgi:hypothetical protein